MSGMYVIRKYELKTSHPFVQMPQDAIILSVSEPAWDDESVSKWVDTGRLEITALVNGLHTSTVTREFIALSAGDVMDSLDVMGIRSGRVKFFGTFGNDTLGVAIFDTTRQYKNNVQIKG